MKKLLASITIAAASIGIGATVTHADAPSWCGAATPAGSDAPAPCSPCDTASLPAGDDLPASCTPIAPEPIVVAPAPSCDSTPAGYDQPAFCPAERLTAAPAAAVEVVAPVTHIRKHVTHVQRIDVAATADSVRFGRY